MNLPCLWSNAEFLGDREPPNAIPLALHPYPQDAILDLFAVRMIFVIFVNPGKLVAALSEAGYECEALGDSRGTANSSIMVWKRFRTPSGSFVKLELRNLAHQT